MLAQGQCGDGAVLQRDRSELLEAGALGHGRRRLLELDVRRRATGPAPRPGSPPPRAGRPRSHPPGPTPALPLPPCCQRRQQPVRLTQPTVEARRVEAALGQRQRVARLDGDQHRGRRTGAGWGSITRRGRTRTPAASPPRRRAASRPTAGRPVRRRTPGDLPTTRAPRRGAFLATPEEQPLLTSPRLGGAQDADAHQRKNRGCGPSRRLLGDSPVARSANRRHSTHPLWQRCAKEAGVEPTRWSGCHAVSVPEGSATWGVPSKRVAAHHPG